MSFQSSWDNRSFHIDNCLTFLWRFYFYFYKAANTISYDESTKLFNCTAKCCKREAFCECGAKKNILFVLWNWNPHKKRNFLRKQLLKHAKAICKRSKIHESFEWTGFLWVFGFLFKGRTFIENLLTTVFEWNERK